MSRVSHGLDRVVVKFDDPNLVANGGLSRSDSSGNSEPTNCRDRGAVQRGGVPSLRPPPPACEAPDAGGCATVEPGLVG